MFKIFKNALFISIIAVSLVACSGKSSNEKTTVSDTSSNVSVSAVSEVATQSTSDVLTTSENTGDTSNVEATEVIDSSVATSQTETQEVFVPHSEDFLAKSETDFSLYFSSAEFKDNVSVFNFFVTNNSDTEKPFLMYPLLMTDNTLEYHDIQPTEASMYEQSIASGASKMFSFPIEIQNINSFMSISFNYVSDTKLQDLFLENVDFTNDTMYFERYKIRDYSLLDTIAVVESPNQDFKQFEEKHNQFYTKFRTIYDGLVYVYNKDLDFFENDPEGQKILDFCLNEDCYGEILIVDANEELYEVPEMVIESGEEKFFLVDSYNGYLAMIVVDGEVSYVPIDPII